MALTEEILAIAPEHTRALNNKEYYIDLLRQKTPKSDGGPIVNVKKVDLSNIKNQRPKDYLEEREQYEKLCRQTESKVNENLVESSSSSISVHITVKSQTTSKIILSVSS